MINKKLLSVDGQQQHMITLDSHYVSEPAPAKAGGGTKGIKLPPYVSRGGIKTSPPTSVEPVPTKVGRGTKGGA